MRTTSLVVSLATLLFLLSSSVQSVSAQSCQAELTVEKNRNTKSADESGATYWLELKNQSPFADTFTIVTRNLETSCSNKNRSSSEANVNLNVGVFADDGRNPMPESVTVAGGETLRFKIDISVPAGTLYNRWSCIEVQANSNNCSPGVVTTTLRVYVPDPSED